MEEIRETAAETATDLEDSGVVAAARPEVYRNIKRQLDIGQIDHEHVRGGFEDAGWVYSRHLYFHPEGLAERVAEIGDELRAEGRVIADHREVCDRLVGVEDTDESREQVTGWEQGAFVEALAEAFEETGWTVDETGTGGRTKRFYFLPLFELFERHHPDGSWPLSTAELFAYYLSSSVTAALGDE